MPSRPSACRTGRPLRRTRTPTRRARTGWAHGPATPSAASGHGSAPRRPEPGTRAGDLRDRAGGLRDRADDLRHRAGGAGGGAGAGAGTAGRSADRSSVDAAAGPAERRETPPVPRTDEQPAFPWSTEEFVAGRDDVDPEPTTRPAPRTTPWDTTDQIPEDELPWWRKPKGDDPA